jgi:hypothetical protein
VVCLLIVLVAIPAVLALTLTGLRATDATRSAGAYGQVGRLATLGQQVVGLAQAMEDERSGTAAFISGGRPAAGLPALRRQYAITDAQAARVRRLVSQLGTGYPAQTQADAAQVLASIAKLPGLRRQAAQSQAPALAVTTGYSAATAGLFPVNDGIADLSGNSALVSNTRALGSLARMADQASQQQAILGVALAEGRFEPGALTALTTAQAQQASDLASFRGSGLPQESWALTQTLAGPPARQAQAVEQRAIAAGDGVLALGPQASQQWSAGMSYTVGWMDHGEQELAAWIPAYAQALQQGAMRSAVVTGGVGLGIVALVLLGTVFAARSMVRWRRRLEAAAPAPMPWSVGAPLPSIAEAPVPGGAGAPMPDSAGAVSAGFFWRSHPLLKRLLLLIDSWELSEDDPQRLASLFEMDHLATQIWRNSDSVLVLTGHEPPRPAEPLALLDVLRAASSEIEQYNRVTLDVQQGVWVSGSAAADTVHLLAELLENATAFSPETTQVIVSGHAVYAGGSLITITDSGTGMSEEGITLLNRHLVDPAITDMTAAPHIGLSAVALLAARHGITVTLSVPPDGGTTVEVYLPAALISLDAGPGGRRGPAGEAPSAETSAEPVPLLLGAPVPSAAPGTSPGGTEPGPVSSEQADEPPIFESVRSGHIYAFGQDLPGASEQQAGQSPAGQPARPEASGGYGTSRPLAWSPTAGRPAASGLPQRVPQPGRVRGRAAGQETRQDPVAEPDEITRSKLAGSFQRGSRQAQAAAGPDRGAKQPGQDD